MRAIITAILFGFLASVSSAHAADPMSVSIEKDINEICRKASDLRQCIADFDKSKAAALESERHQADTDKRFPGKNVGSLEASQKWTEAMKLWIKANADHNPSLLRSQR